MTLREMLNRAGFRAARSGRDILSRIDSVGYARVFPDKCRLFSGGYRLRPVMCTSGTLRRGIFRSIGRIAAELVVCARAGAGRGGSRDFRDCISLPIDGRSGTAFPDGSPERSVNYRARSGRRSISWCDPNVLPRDRNPLNAAESAESVFKEARS